MQSRMISPDKLLEILAMLPSTTLIALLFSNKRRARLGKIHYRIGPSIFGKHWLTGSRAFPTGLSFQRNLNFSCM